MSTSGEDAAPAALATAPAALAAVTAPAAIGLHGVAVAFDPAIEDWLELGLEYVERLSHYFAANDIVSEDKKKAILLNAVGPSTYRLIRTLASPSKVTDLSFEDIVDKARAHFCPKPSPIVKRYDETAGGRRVYCQLRRFAEEDRGVL